MTTLNGHNGASLWRPTEDEMEIDGLKAQLAGSQRALTKALGELTEARAQVEALTKRAESLEAEAADMAERLSEAAKAREMERNAAALDEREACAKVADEYEKHGRKSSYGCGWGDAAWSIARQIRARGGGA